MEQDQGRAFSMKGISNTIFLYLNIGFVRNPMFIHRYIPYRFGVNRQVKYNRSNHK